MTPTPPNPRAAALLKNSLLISTTTVLTRCTLSSKHLMTAFLTHSLKTRARSLSLGLCFVPIRSIDHLWKMLLWRLWCVKIVWRVLGERMTMVVIITVESLPMEANMVKASIKSFIALMITLMVR